MVLTLSHNRLENITGDSFGADGLGEMTSLSLDHNLISELEIERWANFES